MVFVCFYCFDLFCFCFVLFFFCFFVFVLVVVVAAAAAVVVVVAFSDLIKPMGKVQSKSPSRLTLSLFFQECDGSRNSWSSKVSVIRRR